MVKYILILVIAFGAYKYFTEETSLLSSSSQELVFEDYNFKATFLSKPEISSKINDITGYGKFKVTTFRAKDEGTSCVVSISEYLGEGVPKGTLEDGIRPGRQGLLRRFSGVMNSENYIEHDGVNGYEMNITSKEGKSVKNRMFMYKQGVYNLLCVGLNSQSDEFLSSVSFI